MFRKLAKKNKAISEEACIEILKNQKRGILSVLGDDDYPYGTPLNHFYDEESGKIYFHIGSQRSHRTEAVRNCDKVCFTCYDAGWRREGEWALNVNSVIVFGRISLVTDEDKARLIGMNLCRKFTDDEEYIRHEIQNALPRVQCLELTIDHMTGKLVNES